ncbi:hypothetical protein Zmor_009641 [Zophobas morio]|uniref:Uncharacterized protein n=1 Tax=Zophobas morio TaxID=2755281 RepID=A0AA38ILP7_9CUCU|nr:hypothetical protein Zmor_009641 [Zophobas morio]
MAFMLFIQQNHIYCGTPPSILPVELIIHRRKHANICDDSRQHAETCIFVLSLPDSLCDRRIEPFDVLMVSDGFNGFGHNLSVLEAVDACKIEINARCYKLL